MLSPSSGGTYQLGPNWTQKAELVAVSARCSTEYMPPGDGDRNRIKSPKRCDINKRQEDFVMSRIIIATLI
jgi:hypothetical protein